MKSAAWMFLLRGELSPRGRQPRLGLRADVIGQITFEGILDPVEDEFCPRLELVVFFNPALALLVISLDIGSPPATESFPIKLRTSELDDWGSKAVHSPIVLHVDIMHDHSCKILLPGQEQEQPLFTRFFVV